MNQTRLNVRIEGVMADHVDGLIEQKLYNSQSEYVRDLIRHDMDNQDKSDLASSLYEGYKQLGDGNFREISQDKLFNKAMQELEAQGYEIAD